jgi:hypothetical protein
MRVIGMDCLWSDRWDRRYVMPGREPSGFVITGIIGIVGALLGGYLGRAVGWYREAIGGVRRRRYWRDYPPRALAAVAGRRALRA